MSLIARGFPNFCALVAMVWWFLVADELQTLQPEPVSDAVFLTIFFGAFAWGCARLLVAWWERVPR